MMEPTRVMRAVKPPPAMAKVLRSDGTIEVRLPPWLIEKYPQAASCLTKRVFEDDWDMMTDAEIPPAAKEWSSDPEVQSKLEQTMTNNRKKCCQCHKRHDPLDRSLKCSGCKRVHYCSRECQKEHWPIHRIQCKEKKEETVCVRHAMTVALPHCLSLIHI